MSRNAIVVLVVEDEQLLRMSILAELEDEGFIAYEAAHAAEAISVIERHPEIQLVFTDVDMPGTMDGMILAQFVRDRWPPIKIIVTSGFRAPDALRLPQGVPFMRKPYKAAEVIEAMQALMEA